MSTVAGSKPAARSVGTIGVAAEAPPRPAALVEPLPDPRLHQDPAGRRLHEKAVQRLEEPVLVVELVGDQLVPQDARRRAEDRARVGAERAGLDERDASSPRRGRPTSGRRR